MAFPAFDPLVINSVCVGVAEAIKIASISSLVKACSGEEAILAPYLFAN